MADSKGEKGLTLTVLGSGTFEIPLNNPAFHTLDMSLKTQNTTYLYTRAPFRRRVATTSFLNSMILSNWSLTMPSSQPPSLSPRTPTPTIH